MTHGAFHDGICRSEDRWPRCWYWRVNRVSKRVEGGPARSTLIPHGHLKRAVVVMGRSVTGVFMPESLCPCEGFVNGASGLADSLCF